MEYSETEKQMLREILPGIATQLRGSLANIHAALGRLAPEQARDASTDTDRSAAILCQSYYRILRVVNNLSDAPMLAEEKPLDTENVELVRFLDGLCRQGEALAQLMELRLEDVDENLLRFTCYVAVCYTVYGQSFESLTTEHILGLVSQIRPDMVKELKANGSGKLPKDIQRRKTEHFTASANDVFATIRITARDSTEECYGEILDYLCAVLEQEEFPRSYSVEFRGKEKLYLPIPGLPKRGVNQLFACAVQHPDLHPAMERYARLAMREFEWYQNLADEACAMPGSFAVFALGLEGEPWAPLVCDYLDLCDDEHSSLQEKFIHAFFKKYGFTAQTIPVLVHGVQSMQGMKPDKEFRTLIANEESLNALLEVKGHLEDYLPEENFRDKKAQDFLWQDVLWGIWGQAAQNGGGKVIKAAPAELREQYQKIFQ